MAGRLDLVVIKALSTFTPNDRSEQIFFHKVLHFDCRWSASEEI